MFLRAVNILGLQQLNGTRGLLSLAMMSLRTSSEAVKKHGSDPRSLNDFTTEDIEKMKNVSFSDPEYTNKVLLVVNLASF